MAGSLVPNAFLLAVTEVNVNLAAQYFGGIKQIGQIEFRKLLAKTLIFNSYYDDQSTIHQKRSRNSVILAIVSSCSPSEKNLGMQIITANSKYPQHKCNTCSKRVHTYCMCSPQGSISVQNVSATILHALKTIFQHQAELSCSKIQKNGSALPSLLHCIVLALWTMAQL